MGMLSFNIAQGGGGRKNVGTCGLIVRHSMTHVNSSLVSQVVLARIVACAVSLPNKGLDLHCLLFLVQCMPSAELNLL